MDKLNNWAAYLDLICELEEAIEYFEKHKSKFLNMWMLDDEEEQDRRYNKLIKGWNNTAYIHMAEDLERDLAYHIMINDLDTIPTFIQEIQNTVSELIAVLDDGETECTLPWFKRIKELWEKLYSYYEIDMEVTA